MRALIASLIVLTAQAAAADDHVTTIDRGDAVEVIVPGATAATTTLSPVRERLEVALAGDPTAFEKDSIKDATLREIDVRGDHPRTLSIKLRMDRVIVRDLAPHAVVAQMADGVHVVVPRSLDAAVPAPTPPPPSASASPPAAPIAPPAPAPKPVATPTPAVTPAPAAAPAPTPAPAPVATAKPMPAPAPAPSGLPIGTLAIGGLAAAAGVVALLKKKKTPAIGELDVVAARSLGGKARVVWLNAGERSLVVAVTPQNVRLLAQWRRDRGVAADEPALSELLAPAPAPKAPEPPARTDLPRAVAQNPALSGILRLRERASTQQTEAITTGDTEADEQWAREILAAMGSRR